MSADILSLLPDQATDDDEEARHVADVAAKITERGRSPQQRAELRRLFDYGLRVPPARSS